MNREEITTLINENIGKHGACALSKGTVEEIYPAFLEGLARLTTEYAVTTTVLDDTLHVVLRPRPKGGTEIATINVKPSHA